MCDTVVAMTDSGVLFAKNSDRDANEAQIVEWHPGSVHEAGSSLRCTWIDIPQVTSTRAVVISRPWWMWGAEMGANDAHVVIGNEAVYTTEPNGDPALLGMDLLRLALERSGSAEEAASVIVELLERHGQGGQCSHERPGATYHNSFLIADPNGAIILETAGQRWASEMVRGPSRSISNGLTIAGFADAYARRAKGRLIACSARRAMTEASAMDATGPLSMMATLRMHARGAAPRWRPANGSLGGPCVHAGGILASSQTTASMVSDLRAPAMHWMTATSAPCTSLFKPVRIDEPVDVGDPTNRSDMTSAWWAHERLHRATMTDWSRWHATYADERDAIERAWAAAPPPSADAFEAGALAEAGWLARLRVDGDRRPRWVRRTWRALDSASGASTPAAAR